MHEGPAPFAIWQGSLFGGGPTVTGSCESDSDGLTRHNLGRGAWLDFGAGWLGGADELFERLLHGLDWQAREMPMYGQIVAQPRLGAWWSIAEPDASPLHAEVAQIARALEPRYGVEFDSVGCNLYRDGRDSVAFHGDRHARQPNDADVVVAIVSLGSPRRLLLRPRSGGSSVAFDVAGGDLVVMGGSCQRTWQHSIPKQARAGARISVTFRHQPRQ